MSHESGEHTSNDDTSTIEPISVDTTLIINSAKCFFCTKILGYQGRFSSNSKYHYACLEKQNCMYCGCDGLLKLCSEKGCTNVFHLFCLQRYHSNSLIDKVKCSDHCENKKEKHSLWVNSFRKIANNIQTDDKRLENYKISKGEIKSNFFSHGQIFWSIIGTQFFAKNAKLTKIPFLYPEKKSPKIGYEKTWISNQIKNFSKDYKSIKKKNKEIFLTILPKKIEKSEKISKEEKSSISEKDLLISESRSLRFKKFEKKFLIFCESSKNQEIVTDEETLPCLICSENDYEDDDQIISCGVCKSNVHLQCYGNITDPLDWVCLSCKETSESKNFCPLCPIAKGVLKPTININGSGRFTHNNLPNGVKIWTHVFCALHIENTCIRDKSKIENIDLKCIDKKKFSEVCEICHTNNGACIKCNVNKCKKFFHPECGKKNFLYTRNKTGNEDVNIYCDFHKPSKLRKTLEIREKKNREGFVEFIKNYERTGRECLKRVSTSDFPPSEKFKLYEFLDILLESKRGEFEIDIKWGGFDKALRGFVEENKDFVTFVEPEAFINDDISTDRLNNYEFQDFYEKNMLSVYKQELKIMKIPLIGYKGEKSEVIDT